MRNPEQFSLEGKTAVVTGASRGIGAAIAAGLQASGAKVFGISRSGTAPQHVTAVACDLSDDAAVQRAFDHLADHGDRLDVLVNAAGISLPASAGKSELQRFRDTLATDLTGVESLARSLPSTRGTRCPERSRTAPARRWSP